MSPSCEACAFEIPNWAGEAGAGLHEGRDGLGRHRDDGPGEQDAAVPDRAPERGHDDRHGERDHHQDVPGDHQARVGSGEGVAHGQRLRLPGRRAQREAVPRRGERGGYPEARQDQHHDGAERGPGRAAQGARLAGRARPAGRADQELQDEPAAQANQPRRDRISPAPPLAPVPPMARRHPRRTGRT